jgi:cell division protein FtsB
VNRRLVVAGFVAVAGYYAAFGGEYSALELHGIGREVREATVELQEIEAITERLALRADALESDPKVLETLARESFGMIRDGEVLYRFADPREPEVQEGSQGPPR